jgi:uncharacterized protein YjbI with pentapeptide repeats
MLVLFASFFSLSQSFLQRWQEDMRQQQIAIQNAKLQQQIAAQTAELQGILEESRVQETALQSYLDLMVNLLLEHDLRDAEPDSDVVAIAQSQTFATLRKMDPQGKRTIAVFLRDAGLIQAPGGAEPIVGLAEADLSQVNLSNVDLRDANLEGADLSNADLSGAEGVTEEQVSQAASLEGTTMPTGQKYKDWLKSKGHGEHGKDSGPS